MKVLCDKVAKLMATDCAELTIEEVSFLVNMTERRISFGTPRQRARVDEIGVKVFGAQQWEAFCNERL